MDLQRRLLHWFVFDLFDQWGLSAEHLEVDLLLDLDVELVFIRHFISWLAHRCLDFFLNFFTLLMIRRRGAFLFRLAAGL